MPQSFILTCEHAGNNIPAAYEHLFYGQEEVLYSHKAIDFGALWLAKSMAKYNKLPFYFTSTSRLLVEANRSLDNEELFSQYTKNLPEPAKETILEQFYFPHRKQVESAIKSEITNGNQVIHLAVHTFTPAMDGKVRETDIGILFDPVRSFEQRIADIFKIGLLAQNSDLKVQYNSPYPGIADGLPTYLRKQFTDPHYAGFELEVNQKFFLSGEKKGWNALIRNLTAALALVIKNQTKY
ncbi:N-formylglutamate amidohydrolase [Adhaeribacter aquaticus]|uniref:N-formylglutamate amidohydrolase n=1 Tax=Adhaeribacter aquaticus TaxID=299567 RepID=UPI0003F71075|nr:N-formylglutamate amidohydrolase [Adhaeribacter aquaticus]